MVHLLDILTERQTDSYDEKMTSNLTANHVAERKVVLENRLQGIDD